MTNPLQGIRNWFFELIEDAVGTKSMEKYKEEMTKKGKSKEKRS